MNSGIMSDCAGGLKVVWPSPYSLSIRTAIRRFARSARGGAALELALGAVVLTLTAAMCFDIYSRITADTALGRMAVTMADYVSLEVAPEKAQMMELGEFLHERELGVPADLVFVVTAIHQPPGNPLPALRVLWKHDEIRIGNASETGNLAASEDCVRHVDPDDHTIAKLPAGFTMLENEVVIIAEVCAQPTAQGSITDMFVGGMYRVHALPFRDSSQLPAAPT